MLKFKSGKKLIAVLVCIGLIIILLLSLVSAGLFSGIWNKITGKAIDDSSLVGYWKFDESSGTTAGDSSGNGNAGTINGATFTTGKVNGALDFDGVNDYINVGNQASLQITTQTICAWVKTTDTNGYIYGGRDDNIGGGSLFFTDEFWFVIGSNNPTASSNTAINDGAWHHVCATFDDATNEVNYYLDGSSDGITDNTGNFNHTIDKYIGFRVSGSGFHHLKGTIDEVRIYNRALTPSEITELYNYGGTPCTNESVSTTCGTWVCGTRNNNCGDPVNCPPGCGGGEICSSGSCIPAPTCTDNDNDGYNISQTGCGIADCNDSNINIRPSATEVCNDGVDNNCNLQTDCSDSDCSLDSTCQSTNPSNTYYISTTGSDSNDGSKNSPWATFDYVLKNTGPGDTVYCREGTYTKTVDNYNMNFRGGSAGAWWTLSSYPGETCTFDASIKFYYNVQYIRIKNLNIINGRTLKIEKPSSFDDASMAHDIEFIGNTLTGPQPSIGYLRFYGNRILIENNTIISSGGGGSLDHGIYAHIGSDYIIRGNYIENTYGHGIQVYDENKPYKISNVLIENNILKKSRGRSGVIIAHGGQTSVDNVTIRNNIITDNVYAGVVVSGGRTDNIKIYNNIIYNNNYGNNNRGQIYITEQYGDPSNIEIKNNIVDFASSPYPAHIRLKFGTAINVACDNNLYYPGPINNKDCTDNNGIVGNPNFVDIPNNDFHLQSSSPAIDAGATIPSITTDYDSNPRPMDGNDDGTAEYDIGAYEYTGTYVPPACQDNDGDGETSKTCGGTDCNDYDVSTQACHGADTDNSGCVEIFEMNNNVNRWLIDSADVTIDELAGAIDFWIVCE